MGKLDRDGEADFACALRHDRCGVVPSGAPRAIRRPTAMLAVVSLSRTQRHCPISCFVLISPVRCSRVMQIARREDGRHDNLRAHRAGPRCQWWRGAFLGPIRPASSEGPLQWRRCAGTAHGLHPIRAGSRVCFAERRARSRPGKHGGKDGLDRPQGNSLRATVQDRSWQRRRATANVLSRSTTWSSSTWSNSW
jgi:hypothetical protein